MVQQATFFGNKPEAFEISEYIPKLAPVSLLQTAVLAAGCAMVLFRTDKAALLGAVATVPEFRGRGIAGALVTRLANQELADEKRKLLFPLKSQLIIPIAIK